MLAEKPLRIGPYTVESIQAGAFALDGGAMFGIVPRPLWQRTNPADDRNRIDLAARCLLVRSDRRCILVETGIGDKFDEKRAEIFKVSFPCGGLIEQLGERGVRPSDVTDVILTHLHFDHCGGTTRHAGGATSLSFPRATHHVQRRHWEWARAPSAKDAGSFRSEDFALLDGSDRLHLLDGKEELFEGIRVHPVDGHTRAMQLVSIAAADDDDDAQGLLFCADLVPTRAHLRCPYIMAYDNEPLLTLQEKQRWLPAVVDSGDVLVFGHDPTCDAAVLGRDGDAVVIVREIDLPGPFA